MKVLVINCGSSSLKYQLINADSEEVLAKGLSSIEKLPEEELKKRIESVFDGKILDVVKKHCNETDTRKLAVRFFLYGLIAELFGRETGLSKGFKLLRWETMLVAFFRKV